MEGKGVPVRWLNPPRFNFGTTFGLPWSKGQYYPSNTTFTCSDEAGLSVPLESWTTGYWPDGSIKWTGHAIPATGTISPKYLVHATVDDGGRSSSSSVKPGPHDQSSRLTVKYSERSLVVHTGKISVDFATSGDCILRSLTASNGAVVGENGHLVLLSQDTPQPSDSDYGERPWQSFRSRVEETVLDQQTPIRALVTVRGKHHVDNTTSRETGKQTGPWVPFILRFYLYAGSSAIRVVHTIIYDGDPANTFIRGIGLRFDVPLQNTELHNRHVRYAGTDGGVLSEAVQGVTGLWREPGERVRSAQVEGRSAPPFEQWNKDFTPLFKWVPTWGDYTLSQLTPDGFTFKKRTKQGHSWVSIQSGTRAGGLAHLGSAHTGGLSVGLRNFWERYPTSLDIRNAAAEHAGQITLWLYSPSAEPMDMRPYHDGLGQEGSYENQLDALKITYEDWEEGFGTPYGIARTNEVFLFAQEETPTADYLSQLAIYINDPPLLVADPDYIYQTSALGRCWSPIAAGKGATGRKDRDGAASGNSFDANSLEGNLDFLFEYYKNQISQRRWYGFWDHGDIMHTYDEDRHCWRYDVGGYAWDNSELSPDLWLWLYFLRTGRADVYRAAEALSRHTGEVDAYHLGPFRGLGTRHGVQHWSDSCKQARVACALYRRVFYFISGGDERVGDLLAETLDAERTFLTLDPYRKVRVDRGRYAPDATALSVSLGTDWSALASAWYIEWERRGPRWEDARARLLKSIQGIAALRNGFVTGDALLDLHTGAISPPAQDPDNRGFVKVKHLSAMFGLVEICAELIETLGSPRGDQGDSDIIPRAFEDAWLDYCRHFNAPAAEQAARYGAEFGFLKLHQGHSRLTAYAAARRGDDGLAARAWSEFADDADGFDPRAEWVVRPVPRTAGLLGSEVDEAPWVSTNIAALYGLAAIQNLAWIGDVLEGGSLVDER